MPLACHAPYMQNQTAGTVERDNTFYGTVEANEQPRGYVTGDQPAKTSLRMQGELVCMAYMSM